MDGCRARLPVTPGGALVRVAKDNDQTAAIPLPPKEAPESLELRAKPRPVTRLNPRMLAVLVGGLSAAVLGAMLWSLQPQQRRQGAEPNELYNVDRVARSEGLEQLPADYSQLPPPLRLLPSYRNWGHRCPAIWAGPSSGPSSRPRPMTTAMLALTRPRPSGWPGSRKPRKQRSPPCFSAQVAGGRQVWAVRPKAGRCIRNLPDSAP